MGVIQARGVASRGYGVGAASLLVAAGVIRVMTLPLDAAHLVVEAAISLGAPPWRAFLDVTLPLARTGVIAGGLMAFVLSFDEVAVSLFLSDAFTQTLPIALVAEMRANLNLTVAAVSTVFAAVTILIVLLLDRTIGLDRVVGQGLYRG